MTTRRVKVLRAFFFNREPQKVGAIIELPAPFAAECIAARKAEPVFDEPAPVPAAKPKPDKGEK